MDLRLIDRAVQAYEKDADESDVARLEFFRGLFELQQRRAETVGDGGYEAAPEQLSDKRYIDGEPLFLEVPVKIDEAAFVETCTQVAAYMADHAGLEAAAAEALRAYDWHEFTDLVDLRAAGQDPAGFVEACLQNIDSFELDAALPANLFMMAVSFALRAHLQEAAAKAFAGASEDAKTGNYGRPLTCPVCGSPATLSVVGLSAGIAGRDRVQYCATCGTVWPFERIRCGVCGTKNQGKLHYFHIEGDPAHRLENCEECGRYERVVFQDDIPGPLSPEVEDVVMAKLDKVALEGIHRSED